MVTDSNKTLSGIKMKSSITEIDKEEKQFPGYYALRKIDDTNLWGQFYNFPELYKDEYCHVIGTSNRDSEAFRNEDGLLTRDMVQACLSYFKRIPILGDYVYIKLDLSMKLLVNINVLQHYKYLVYLNLSTNCITDISVLSHLLYLQYLSVDFNKLSIVLDYDTPQWLLTEVYYRYNKVIYIRDLSLFWSLTILDLSHNNIKQIGGLENLRYLRRLDLSFNHIHRLEGLNHLRLLWLDISHNEINGFESGPNKGLHTLQHLEYLNVNVNNIESLKVFSGCTRLRELHACDNKFDALLELPLFMWMHRRLVILDLRYNPICNKGAYKYVVIRTFPIILQLDGQTLDPVDIRTIKMEMSPDVNTAATRRLLAMLYIQQLSRAKVSAYVPPADTTDVPIIVVVGYEAVGKGKLARRIAEECNTNVELGIQHTTSSCHLSGHYKVITRNNFDNMLLAGEFLTYTEADGESYGLSREEAFVSDGKVKIVTMDLIAALMLRLRGYRPYLILANCSDKQALLIRQEERKRARNARNKNCECGIVTTTLQAMMSGRLNLNEIVQDMCPKEYENESAPDSEDRPNKKVKVTDKLIMFLNSSTIIDTEESGSPKNSSLYTLYKTSQSNNENVSETYRGLQEKEIQKEVESLPEFYDTIRNVDKEDHKQFYKERWSAESYEGHIRDDYENIHRNCPGLFWDVIIMDNNDAAFFKLKKIIKNIVNSQKSLKPLYDINFTNNIRCRLVKKKIDSVFQQIAPHQLFN